MRKEYGDLPVMGIKVYEKRNEEVRADEMIREAEREYASAGVLLDAREALFSLRKRYFG